MRLLGESPMKTESTSMPVPATKRKYNKWKPEFDAEMIRDWHGTSLSEFARRFDMHASAVRDHAVKLGLMEWPDKGAESHE